MASESTSFDICEMTVTLPPGAVPGDTWAFRVHPTEELGLHYFQVAPLKEAGDTMHFHSIKYWPKLGQPSIYNLQKVSLPQVKSLARLLHGFSDLPEISPTRPIEDFPTVVFVVPPIRDGDDPNCFPLRFHEWDIVEAYGVPQPAAWAHHLRGSSYEEFQLRNNVRSPRARARVPS